MEISLKNQPTAYSDCPQNKLYHAPTPVSQDSLFIAINRCGTVNQTPTDFFVHRDETYPYSTLHFVTAGQGTLQTAHKSYDLTAGSIFVVHGFQVHRYQSNPENPMGLLWLEFSGGDSQRLLNAITQSGHVVTGDIDLFGQCADLILSPDGPPQQISLKIYSILMKLSEKLNKVTKKQDDIQTAIQSYIDKNLGGDLSLTAISRHFGYNPNYFSQRFKAITGINYNRYVNQRRVTQACLLLVSTAQGMDQICGQLGYYDASHFIRHFEKIIGMTPTAYRNTNNWMAGA